MARAGRRPGACSIARTTRCAASATHIEVWVANDLAFPAGDCRTQIPTSTQITDAQVADLITEFDTQHVPEGDGDLQHAAGPRRHQRPARARRQRQRRRLHRRRRQDRHADRQRPRRQLLHLPGGADVHRRLLLVAVQRAARPQRDDDRRVRLGCTAPTANPPDEPTADLCTSRPARPNLYEGTFAHEWQHLLHYYTDPFETTWINEGLSDFAQTLTGLRRRDGDRVRPAAPTATSTASRASAPCRRRTTPTRATAAARRTR